MSPSGRKPSTWSIAIDTGRERGSRAIRQVDQLTQKRTTEQLTSALCVPSHSWDNGSSTGTWRRITVIPLNRNLRLKRVL